MRGGELRIDGRKDASLRWRPGRIVRGVPRERNQSLADFGRLHGAIARLGIDRVAVAQGKMLDQVVPVKLHGTGAWQLARLTFRCGALIIRPCHGLKRPAE